jgi:hypothetical protein
MTEHYKTPSAPPSEPFVTIKTAAHHLQLPEFKLRRAVKAGLIPSYRLANTRILLRLSEIIGFIEATRVGGVQ